MTERTASASSLISQLTAHFESRLDQSLDFLGRMVSVNSFTMNPAGVTALAELTAAEFAKLGFTDELIPAENPEFGSHLVLTRKGRTDKIIGIVSHLDTVFPEKEEKENNFFWRREGDRYYGPGTIDIKGGTMMAYMALEALQTLAPERFEEVTWVVLVNAAEEHLCPDFTVLCKKRLLPNAKACLVFEMGKVVDGRFLIVTSRKGMARVRLKAEGRSAHAGTQHNRGANALHQLAVLVPQIEALTDYERDLTVNVGVFRGGETVNRVPNLAEAEVEIRAFNQEILDEAVAKILKFDGYSSIKSAVDGFPCSVSVAIDMKEEAWPANPMTDELYRCWEQAAAQCGFQTEPQARGGLSDGNRLWRDIPTIDGLGPGGDNAHCAERSADGTREQEYLDVPSVVPKAVINTVALLNLIES